jgi:hypothetical protein
VNPLKTNSHTAAVETPESRRRSQRVMLRVGLILHFEEKGKKQAVEVHTLVVNTHGAMICASRSFEAETKLDIEHKHTNEHRSARVTRQPQSSPEGYLVPVEFDDAEGDFWHISFPPANWKPLES